MRGPAEIDTEGTDAGLRRENLALTHRVAQLRGALDGLAADNAELRRSLRRHEAEDQHLRSALEACSAERDRSTQVRTMLRSRASRNP